MKSLFGVLLFLFLAVNPISGLTQDNELEYRVKAAFIYNFTKFVDWPSADGDEENGEFQICVVGNEIFNDLLKQTISGKNKNSAFLSSRLIYNQSESQNCDLVFLGVGDELYHRDWVKALNGNPVLTVSEDEHFVDNGGMIQFVIVNGKIRFDINQGSVQNANLQISSRLLSLARQVRR